MKRLLALLAVVGCATLLLAEDVTLLVPPLVHPDAIHGVALSADGMHGPFSARSVLPVACCSPAAVQDTPVPRW